MSVPRAANSWLLAGAAAMIVQLSACAADRTAPEVSRALKSSQCGFATAGVRLVTGQDQWQQLPLKQWSGQSGQASWPAQQWRLVVAMGQQPSLGYGLSFIGASQDGNDLVVKLQSHQPKPGMARGQMLTSPCLVLNIPPKGWSNLVVRGLDRRSIRVHHP